MMYYIGSPYKIKYIKKPFLKKKKKIVFYIIIKYWLLTAYLFYIRSTSFIINKCIIKLDIELSNCTLEVKYIEANNFLLVFFIRYDGYTLNIDL